MQYHIAPLFCRPWTLNGISPRLIESHYEHNYGGTVVRLNAITEELAALDPATTSADAISRLKRDQLAALNSTLLHELYFASLGGDGRAVPEAMASALVRDFGSVDRWRREFVALAGDLAGGSGWVLLSYVPRDGCLVNHAGADHNQTIAGAMPILALDMYEHAYQLSLGRTRPPMWRRSCATLTGRRCWHVTRMPQRSSRRGRWSRRNSPTCPPSRSRRSRPCWPPAPPFRSSTRARSTTARGRRRSWPVPYGAIRSVSRNGSASCRRRNRSSPSASTGSTSAVRPRASCARPASMHATWRAGTSAGRRRKGR